MVQGTRQEALLELVHAHGRAAVPKHLRKRRVLWSKQSDKDQQQPGTLEPKQR